MVTIPEELSREFEICMSGDLPTRTAMRKELAGHRRAIAALGDDAALSVTDGVSALVEAIDRKTSPLYLRLILGAVRIVGPERPVPLRQRDWTGISRVVSSVAWSIKRPDLMLTNS